MARKRDSAEPPGSLLPARQRIDTRSMPSRSPHDQPRAVAMAATASRGAGQRDAQPGVRRPDPSG